MNFKNIAIKTMAAVMAFGFISLAGSTVARAASTNITFSGVEESAAIKEGYTHWAVVKEVLDENKKSFSVDGKHYKAEEVFSVEEKKIDLSFLNKNKDNIIAVGKGDTFAGSEAWEIKAIPKQSKGFHAAYVGAKTDNKVMLKDKEITSNNYINGNDYGFLVATNGTDEYNLKTAKTVQIKLGNGDWQMLNIFFGLGADANIDDSDNKADKTMATLLQSGSTVYLRIPGSADAWPSKEVKVKFDKLKKAPKLTVDTAKGVVNFKKGQEYKLQKGTADAGAWKPVDGKKTFAELTINDLTSDYTIYVRDAAKGKKAASKEAKVALKKQDKVTLQTLTKSGFLITDELDFQVKFPYDIKKGATFINKKGTEYEYFLLDSADENTLPPADAKWHKIKAGKQDKKVATKFKESRTNVKFAADLSKGNAYGEKNENLRIFVRKAGSKQSKLDGSAFLPSNTSKTDGVATFKIVNDIGTITAADASPSGSVKAKKDITTKIDVSIDKLVSKKGVTPKIVITEKLSGVTVKASKITKQGVAAPITVKASKSAFKAANTYKLKFKIFIEGAEKEVTVTYTITE